MTNNDSKTTRSKRSQRSGSTVTDNARLPLKEQNLVAVAHPAIITYLYRGLLDRGYKDYVRKGMVVIEPLDGQSGIPTLEFPHGTQALSFLREQVHFPHISVHFIDQGAKRLIWRYGEHTVFVPLTEPLDDHRFVDMQIHRVLKGLNAEPKERGTVFPGYAPRGAQVQEMVEEVAEEPEESEEVEEVVDLSSISLEELLDKRTLKAFQGHELNSVGDVIEVFKNEGREGLLAKRGISENRLKELGDALKKRGLKLPQPETD